MPVQFTAGRFKADDNSGDPLVGGLLYTYASGTTTPKATYTSSTLGTANTNPVVLDARGEAQVWLGSGSYTMLLQTSAGVTIWSADGITDGARADQLTVDDGSSGSLFTTLQGFITYLKSSLGSAFVGFLQSGGGAVARTVQDKAREIVVTPADFGGGAAGVQAALNAAAGRTVRLVGEFAMGSTALTVPAGSSIDASGAVLTWTAHCIGVTFLGSTSVRSRWTGGKLVGNGSSLYTINSIAMLASGTDNSPSAPTYVLGPEISNVEIDGWGEYGFFGAYLNGGHFRCSEGVKNISYGGVCGVSCNDFELFGNVIESIGPGFSGDAYGTFFDRKDNPSETAQPRSYRISVIGNTIKNVVSSGVNGQGIDTHGGIGFTIVGNNVLNCQAGIYVTSSSISGSQTLGPKHCTVSGNTVKSTYRVNYGIYIGGAVNAGVVAEYADTCTVTGNTIEGHGISGSAVSGALRLQATIGCSVAANTIINPSCNGYIIEADNIGFSICGGSVVDPFDNSYASPNCVLVAGNNNSGYLGGVSMIYRNAGLGTYVAIGSIRVNTGLTGLDIDFDRCPHVGIDATHLQYLPITTTGVNSSGICQLSGSSALVGGNVTVTFSKRFPATPKVLVVNKSDNNTIRVAAASPTQVTFGGTGTSSFDWFATL
jgi:hypothetical protein